MMDNLNELLKNIDFSKAVHASSYLANDFEEQRRERQELFYEIAEHNAKKDAALFQAAEASVAQKELLEQQLAEVKEQNLQLKENYQLLKELYESTKDEAKSSAKEAKANKVFGWVSFAVGTLIGIAGIVLGILL